MIATTSLFYVLLIGVIPFALVGFQTSDAYHIHTVGDYRIEIGWIEEPPQAGDKNGVEIIITPWEDGKLTLKTTGLTNADETLDTFLIYDDERTKLNLVEDHREPGRYYALVLPTLDGTYRLGLVGDIADTTFDHEFELPPIRSLEYTKVPLYTSPSKIEIQPEGQEIQDIKTMQNVASFNGMIYLGIGLGAAAVVIATVSLVKRR